MGAIRGSLRKVAIKSPARDRHLESGRIYPNKHLELGGWRLSPEVWGFLGRGRRADAEKGVKIPLLTFPAKFPSPWRLLLVSWPDFLL